MHKSLAAKAMLTLNNCALMHQSKQASASTDCATHPRHITTKQLTKDEGPIK